jgi:hypothetical protein
MPMADAVQRIAQIQAQMASLQGGAAAPAQAAATMPVGAVAGAPLANAAAAPGATVAPGATTAPGTSFSSVLAQAQGVGVGGAAAPLSLSPRVQEMLTGGQKVFVQQLAAETGLDQRVVAAWCLAEQSSTAADAREAAGNHNWLNIGWTDSGTYGANAGVWSDPSSAAHATAGWLEGQDTVDGYGRASSGVQAILNTAGQAPETQVAALQRSGWASSGYPDLPVLLRQVSG